jgi:LAS superfamily LD-carboxypeptidase LdcB
MTFPVRPIRLPADLRDVENGRIPEFLLVGIKPYGKLHRVTADAWRALRWNAHRDGIRPMKPTSTADTYRSFEQQRAGFLARYQREQIPGASTRTWKGETFFLRKGFAPMAVPGTSNHGLGLAIDVWSASGERLAWMRENILRFGFSWEIQSEPWHIRFTEGDRKVDAVEEWREMRSRK